jgi:hypothetical protein
MSREEKQSKKYEKRARLLSLPLKIYDIERKKEGESSDSVKGNKWYKIKYEIGGIEMPEEGVSEKVRK